MPPKRSMANAPDAIKSKLRGTAKKDLDDVFQLLQKGTWQELFPFYCLVAAVALLGLYNFSLTSRLFEHVVPVNYNIQEEIEVKVVEQYHTETTGETKFVPSRFYQTGWLDVVNILYYALVVFAFDNLTVDAATFFAKRWLALSRWHQEAFVKSLLYGCYHLVFALIGLYAAQLLLEESSYSVQALATNFPHSLTFGIKVYILYQGAFQVRCFVDRFLTERSEARNLNSLVFSAVNLFMVVFALLTGFHHLLVVGITCADLGSASHFFYKMVKNTPASPKILKIIGDVRLVLWVLGRHVVPSIFLLLAWFFFPAEVGQEIRYGMLASLVAFQAVSAKWTNSFVSDALVSLTHSPNDTAVPNPRTTTKENGSAAATTAATAATATAGLSKRASLKKKT